MPFQDRPLVRQDALPHILVVEDEPISRELFAHMLQSDHRVTCVEDGLGAFEILRRESVDTILLDLMMPGMSGLEVLETIRRTPAIADIPVILMSVLGDDKDVVHGLQVGANDYIVKPSDVNVIRARVNTQVTLKRLVDEHKRTIAELSAAQEMRDRLFRIASHDLKNPLTNIRMAEYILRDLIGENPSGQEILDTMLVTIANMQNVIEEFLDVGAFQNGKIDLKLQPTSVDDAVMDVIMQYGLLAAHKEIQLEVGALPGTVIADQGRLVQILGNLVSNAIKYSPRNSVVSIWSELVHEAVRISVSDQGAGIPADERHLLFQEFSKLSTRPTGDESSTGLGLWIVKQLVAAQNGKVGVDCPPDGGSIFWVELPLATLE